jgi:UDP-N-acetylmuramyl pentapeptide phosphotransferase/UDP-N-acetylglucosamine-1-phosphate transferase
MIQMLLSTTGVAFIVAAIGSFVGLTLFPWFRSGEKKEGHFRPDQSTGSYRVEKGRGLRRARISHASASELPIVGGPAMLLGVAVAGVAAGFALGFGFEQWELLGILLAAMLGYGLVGFYDDWQKVHRGVGISELRKAIGVVTVSLAAAIALNRLIVPPYFAHLTARLAYPPYSDMPVLGSILVHAHFAWIVFFLLLTVAVCGTTSLAVDFADGMDGLCGGLAVSAALSFAAILLTLDETDLWPAAVAALAIVGASAGFLPFNWPSSWRARNQGRGKRRARIIMGDTGSLAIGGLLALVAIVARLEFVLLFIGGVFVLEGLSALISARILVKFYRRFLALERYGGPRGFPHTEFPLPFLATPMHHHYDLLGWDRKRLVYGAWLLSAGLGVLGVASTVGTFTWERYLARFVAFLILVAVWQVGPWTRNFFIGLTTPSKAQPDAPRRLTLNYGFPFRLFGRPLYHRVDTTEVAEGTLQTAAERLTLWQRMSVFDARATLGFYCYRADALEDANRVWSRLPAGNLAKRPEIAELVAAARHALALRADDHLPAFAAGESGLPRATEAPGAAGPTGLAGVDPAATVPAQRRLNGDDPNGSAWRMPSPSLTGSVVGQAPRGPRLEPLEPSSQGDTPASPSPYTTNPPVAPAGAPLWSASRWAAASSSGGDLPQPPRARGDVPPAG